MPKPIPEHWLKRVNLVWSVQDRGYAQAIREHYNLRSLGAAIRLALLVTWRGLEVAERLRQLADSTVVFDSEK